MYGSGFWVKILSIYIKYVDKDTKKMRKQTNIDDKILCKAKKRCNFVRNIDT